jgi:hypothetical protein
MYCMSSQEFIVRRLVHAYLEYNVTFDGILPRNILHTTDQMQMQASPLLLNEMYVHRNRLCMYV